MNRICLLLLLFIYISVGSVIQAKSVVKEILIPKKSLKENKFNQSDGTFSYDYMAESENLVLFWDSSFGKDPTNMQIKVNVSFRKKF